MKTLYISDLDGTLLNENAVLSKETEDGLNALAQKNVLFSVATARTHATVTKMLANVKISVPVILMNGVAVFDLETKKYVSVESISAHGKDVLFSVIRDHIRSGFVYCIDNHELSTYYENTSSPNAKQFIEERERLYKKKFTKVESFSECMNNNVVYFSIDDKKEKLETAYGIISECPDLHAEFYRDIYNTDHWYLEVCSCNASKKNAVNTLRKLYGFDKIISFGDNLNDIPMFEASDESYAVMNAKDEVKKSATAVIESNINNGVVKFIESRI